MVIRTRRCFKKNTAMLSGNAKSVTGKKRQTGMIETLKRQKYAREALPALQKTRNLLCQLHVVAQLIFVLLSGTMPLSLHLNASF